jgi:enamine deaminase RidA (YjgF/YER057c/UK114 family)
MAVKRDRIQPEGVHVRVRHGHVMFSNVVAVEGAKRLIYVAGQVSRDVDGNVVGKGDMRAQIEQVCKNIEKCLVAAGASLKDVVETTTYATDLNEFFKHVDVRSKYFEAAMPASTTIEVSGLAGDDFMVEITARAVVG